MSGAFKQSIGTAKNGCRFGRGISQKTAAICGPVPHATAVASPSRSTRCPISSRPCPTLPAITDKRGGGLRNSSPLLFAGARCHPLEKHDCLSAMSAASAKQVPEKAAILQKAAGDPDKLGSRISTHGKNSVKTMSCAASGQTGTAIAILHLPIGCAPASVFRHGGARLSARRKSDDLTLAQCRKLMDAAIMAKRTGRPFNRHITVHWESAGVPDHAAMKATTAFLKYLRDWMGGSTAYAWARENGEGKGSHLHILAHIPTGRQLSGVRSRRWIERIAGQPYKRGIIRTRGIAGAGEPSGDLYAANLRAVLSYVLKGASEEAAAVLGIGREPGGTITGKRCGTSRNIGAKAR